MIFPQLLENLSTRIFIVMISIGYIMAILRTEENPLKFISFTSELMGLQMWICNIFTLSIPIVHTIYKNSHALSLKNTNI